MNYPTRAEIEELSPDERLRLIGDVWDTLNETPESLELSDEHCALLDQRLDQLEKNPENTISRDEMLRKIGKTN